jgi:hypothetical protein
MKDVLSLTRAITDPTFYKEMFDEWGEEKNILFVSPQLSGKHLYKTLLPYFLMQSKEISTAITSLKRYDHRKQLLGYEIDLTNDMIQWADFIVFPFTTQPLVEEIYNSIRANKPEVKIVYSVDFNFYEISKNHPYSDIFEEETVISDVEDNMFFADMVLTGNIELSKYLVEKFSKLTATKYEGTESFMGIATLPTMIDSELVLKNIEYDIEKSVLINAKPLETIHTETVVKVIEKVTSVAEEVKEKNLLLKQEESINKEHIQTYSTETENVNVNVNKSEEKNKQENNGSEKISKQDKKTKKTVSHGAAKSTAKSDTKSKSTKRKRGKPKKEK